MGRGNRRARRHFRNRDYRGRAGVVTAQPTALLSARAGAGACSALANFGATSDLETSSAAYPSEHESRSATGSDAQTPCSPQAGRGACYACASGSRRRG